MDDFDLTERLITAAEFASMLGVTEDDVLEWMLAGHIPYVEGPQREPRVRIAEEHSVDEPISSGLSSYSISDAPTFRAELARRRREHELGTLDWGDVDVEALADALATRLRPLVPSAVRVVTERATVFLRDADGHGIGIDIAFHASFPEAGSGADRVRAAAASVLEAVQDELTMVTTEPWPLRGRGELPTAHADSRRPETASACSTVTRRPRSWSSSRCGSSTSSPPPARDQRSAGIGVPAPAASHRPTFSGQAPSGDGFPLDSRRRHHPMTRFHSEARCGSRCST